MAPWIRPMTNTCGVRTERRTVRRAMPRVVARAPAPRAGRGRLATRSRTGADGPEPSRARSGEVVDMGAILSSEKRAGLRRGLGPAAAAARLAVGGGVGG